MNEENTNAPNGQDKQPKTRMNLNNMAKKMSGGNKTAGIIIAICMVVLGILIWVKPVASAFTLGYIVTVGFIIYGVFEVVMYFKTPSELRNGWTLANGIIFTLLGVLVLLQALGSLAGALDMLSLFSFLIGFFALFGGITQIASYGAFKKSGEPGSGWILASGIINLVLGIMIIAAPFAGFAVLEWIFSFYLILGGIALFAEACSGKLARKQ
ncbi:HdeD family acid-resistance protein [Christensenella timonensis]|uniref:HdeD family acid-resistance protein n=1 Tax=Christensenella timonensis TaxID=1816678 RepID=UPI000833E156|nr:DUF308 domain-containing protein [Christensenella timonensis]